MATPKQRSGLFSWTANQDLAGGFSTEALYGLTASGTNQATAALCGQGYSQFTGVPSGTGCILPRADIRGRWFVVENAGSNQLLVYPAVGTKLNGGATNAPYILAAGDVILVISSAFNVSAQLYDYIIITLGSSGGGGGGGVPSTRNLIAGAGLTGGGDLSADRTFNVVANADGSIVVNANDVQVGVLATDSQHGDRGGAALHAVATGSVAGFMSAADKTKLDTIGQRNFRAVSSSTTALITDYYIGVTALSADVVITLPSVSVPEGLELNFKDESGTAGTAWEIRVMPGASDNLDGANMYKALTHPYESMTVVRRNGAWWMI
jgi:hypothetical protein